MQLYYYNHAYVYVTYVIYIIYICIYLNIFIFSMSNLGNSGFTERTSINLERSHRFPHVCTKIMFGKLGEYCLKGNYVRAQSWHNRHKLPGDRYLERSHRSARVFTISGNRCPSLTCLVLPEFLWWHTGTYWYHIQVEVHIGYSMI